MHRLERVLVAGSVTLAVLLAAPARAADTGDDAIVATTPQPAKGVLALRPVSAESLAAYRGGTQVLNDMKLRGIVADNQAINVTTGSNVISDGALAGAAGIPMVIQNSGNNVLIQSATIVNVQVK